MFFHCKILTRYDQYIYIYGILWMNNGIIRYGIILYGIILYWIIYIYICVWDSNPLYIYIYIHIYTYIYIYIYTIPQNPIESRRPPHLSAVAAALNGIHQGPSRWWPRRSRDSSLVLNIRHFLMEYIWYIHIYIIIIIPYRIIPYLIIPSFIHNIPYKYINIYNEYINRYDMIWYDMIWYDVIWYER